MIYQYSKRPQLIALYVSLLVILLVCSAQFYFLVIEYWGANVRLSKGPVIWTLCLIIIHRNLSRGLFKITITDQDLLITALFLPLLWISLSIDPLIAPTLLVIYTWYLLSSAVKFNRLLIVWLFLIFSLPYISNSDFFLQPLTVLVSEYLLRIVGIPVLVQEFYIAIPAGLFFVESSCSGMGYMAVNLLLFFLFTLMGKPDLRRFILGLLATIVTALLVNWIRVVLVILIAHNFGIDHSLVQGRHIDLGCYLYAVIVGPYFYLLLKIDKYVSKEIRFFKPVTKDMLAIPAIALLVFPLLIVIWQQWSLKA